MTRTMHIELTIVALFKNTFPAAGQDAEITQTVTKDGGRVRLKLYGKLRALELLGRHLGLLYGQQGVDDPYEAARQIRRTHTEMARKTRANKPRDE